MGPRPFVEHPRGAAATFGTAMTRWRPSDLRPRVYADWGVSEGRIRGCIAGRHRASGADTPPGTEARKRRKPLHEQGLPNCAPRGIRTPNLWIKSPASSVTFRTNPSPDLPFFRTVAPVLSLWSRPIPRSCAVRYAVVTPAAPHDLAHADRQPILPEGALRSPRTGTLRASGAPLTPKPIPISELC